MKKVIILMISIILLCGCAEAPVKANQPTEPKPVHIIQSQNITAFEKELGEYIKAGWKLESFTVTQNIEPSGWGSSSRGIEFYIAIVTQKI